MAYNLYVLEDIHTGEKQIDLAVRLASKLGITTSTLYNSVDKGTILRGRYLVEIYQKAIPDKKNWDPDMEERWNRAVVPFKKVVWVKDLEDDVKVLNVEHGR